MTEGQKVQLSDEGFAIFLVPMVETTVRKMTSDWSITRGMQLQGFGVPMNADIEEKYQVAGALIDRTNRLLEDLGVDARVASVDELWAGMLNSISS